MFEVGKVYHITLLEYHGGELAQAYHPNIQVVGVEGTLIKFRQGSTEKIVNTASPHFHSAELKNSP